MKADDGRPIPPPKDETLDQSKVPDTPADHELAAFLTVSHTIDSNGQESVDSTTNASPSASGSHKSSFLNPMKAVSSASSFISKLSISSKGKDKDKEKEKEHESSEVSLKFHSHPSWNYSVYTAILGLRNIVALGKDSVDIARKFTTMQFARVPTPLHVKLTKVKVPRRPELLPFGMDPEHAKGTVKAEWVDDQPEPNNEGPIIMYLHGGAYFLCSRKTHRMVTWRLSKYANARVFAVEYRLAPESVFPLQLHDALSTYIYLTDDLKYKPSQIVFMGDSAGGNLSITTMLYIRDHIELFKGMPAGIGLLSGWLDLTHALPSFISNGATDFLPLKSNDKRYITEDRNHYYCKTNAELAFPYVSPIYASEDPSRPVCPILMQIGSHERLRDENIVFASTVFPNSPIQLEIYEGQVHVFHIFSPFYDMADIALKRLGTFVKSVTSPEFKLPTFTNSIYHVSHSTGFLRQKLSDAEVNKILDEAREVCMTLKEFPPGQDEFLSHLLKTRKSVNRMSSFPVPSDDASENLNGIYSVYGSQALDPVHEHAGTNDEQESAFHFHHSRMSNFSKYTMESTDSAESSTPVAPVTAPRKSILKQRN